ncbi:MAG: hypothetical protein IJ543_01220 [Bacteroidales bacterium]|nr:hypothetical protein [Bacteroidales bacterium]
MDLDLTAQNYTFSVIRPNERPPGANPESLTGSGLSPEDYGSPPPAAAAAHLTSASMVPDFGGGLFHELDAGCFGTGSFIALIINDLRASWSKCGPGNRKESWYKNKARKMMKKLHFSCFLAFV